MKHNYIVLEYKRIHTNLVEEGNTNFYSNTMLGLGKRKTQLGSFPWYGTNNPLGKRKKDKAAHNGIVDRIFQVFKQYRNSATAWPRLSINLLGRVQGNRIGVCVTELCSLTFSFCKRPHSL